MDEHSWAYSISPSFCLLSSKLPALRVVVQPEGAAIKIYSWANTENPRLNEEFDRGFVSYDKPSTQDSALQMPFLMGYKALPAVMLERQSYLVRPRLESLDALL